MQTEWISATDRVPTLARRLGSATQSRRILICAGDTVVIGVRSQSDATDSEPAWIDAGGFLIHGVTHWAELPVAPTNYGAFGSSEVTSRPLSGIMQ